MKSYERAETQLSKNVIFSLKYRYRPPSDFWVSSLQIHLITHAYNELHQMKENPSFPNMCHLSIIISHYGKLLLGRSYMKRGSGVLAFSPMEWISTDFELEYTSHVEMNV